MRNNLGALFLAVAILLPTSIFAQTQSWGAKVAAMQAQIGNLETQLASVQAARDVRLTVLSPNGGNTYQVKTPLTIKWSGEPRKQVTISLLQKVTCVQAPCADARYLLAYAVPSNPSFYSWKAGAVNGGLVDPGMYKIEVCYTNTTTCDNSDSYFTVTRVLVPPTPIPIPPPVPTPAPQPQPQPQPQPTPDTTPTPPTPTDVPPVSMINNTAPVIDLSLVMSYADKGSGPLGTSRAVVHDDGLPYGALSYQWSQIAGPGKVYFTSPNSLSTAVSFVAYNAPIGTYTIRLTVSDGELTTTADKVIYYTDSTGTTYVPPPVTPPTIPPPPVTPPIVSTPQVSNDGSIDTLSYLLTSHPNQGLTGTHPISQSIGNNIMRSVYWSSSAYLTYTWDPSYIYLREDQSMPAAAGGPYTFTPGLWMKRFMNVGETIGNNTNTLRFVNSSCQPVSTLPFNYTTTLEAHYPSYSLGGDLGSQDVIVLKYDYGSSYEKMYYAKGWGMVKWEHYSATNVLLQSSIFNYMGGLPITPTGSCIAG